MGEFDTTLGALCVAYALAWGLFGTMSMQSATYFQKFPKDSLWLKTLVAFLWALDTLQLVLAGNGLYFWVITNYNNAEILEGPSPWSFTVALFLTVISFEITPSSSWFNCFWLVESIFASHASYEEHPWLTINSLSVSGHNIPLTAIIVVLSCCYYGLQVVVKVKLWEFRKLALLYRVQTITGVSLASAVVADLTIAIALSVYLRKGRTGIMVTDSIVDRLVLYAMSTGLLTSIIIFIDMICFLTMPRNYVHLSFNLVSGTLYTNSLLATLNYRHVLRNDMDRRTVNLNTLSLSIAPPPQLNLSSDDGGDETSRRISQGKVN
ncbi:hypothetical protein B0H12DRAFT_1230231 [Mycena haematopus]|nr:hypothetical protein B0H12DRAFT_1230231 [Mycena haematopus]